MTAQRRYAAASGWLRLIRPPNLPTVPGDALAGFLLARLAGGTGSPPAAAWAAAAAVGLYIAGLISNDCADLAEDRRLRPDRPLPSGAVSPGQARAAWMAAAALGVACGAAAGAAAGLTALLLLSCILLYNRAWKGTAAGPLLMGACRGLSVLLGAAAGGRPPAGFATVGLAALGTMLYVAGVTAIAAREMEALPLGGKRWRPALALALCFAALWFWVRPPGPGFPVLAAAALGWSAHVARGLAGTPAPAVTGRAVGAWLRGLLLVQAALAALAGADLRAVAVALVCLWALGALLSRRFYAS